MQSRLNNAGRLVFWHMRLLPLSLLLLSFSMAALAQRGDHRYQYLDEHLRFATKKHYTYKATTEHENDHWVMKATYSDGAVVLRATFSDPELTVKDGLYSIYYSNGQLWMEGSFVRNKANGVWQCWYDNGQLRDSGLISDDHFSGLWKHWYAGGALQKINNNLSFSSDAATNPHDSSFIAGNVIDTLESGMLRFIGVIDGLWQTWYENGQPEGEGTVSHGKPVGVWRWYRENGKPSSVETYLNGKIEKLECYNDQGVLTGNTCSVLKPATFSHPTLSPEKYIANELAKYSLYRSDVGDLKIKFVVTASGKMAGVTVSGVNESNMNFLILGIIKSMPAWSPAVSHNRIIDYPVTLYIYRPNPGY